MGLVAYGLTRQNVRMEPVDRDDRRAAQSVETVLALFLGLATSLVVFLACRIVGAAVGVDGSAWQGFSGILAAILGGGVLVWRLLRARRFGL
jgi:hypothetical protein